MQLLGPGWCPGQAHTSHCTRSIPCAAARSKPAESRRPPTHSQKRRAQGSKKEQTQQPLDWEKLSTWLDRQGAHEHLQVQQDTRQGSDGHAPPEERLGRALVRLPASADIGQVLEGQPLESRHITRLLSYVGKHGTPQRALKTFDWLDERPEYKTKDCVIYTRLMSLFGGGSSQRQTALLLFDRMQAAGVKPDLVAFNAAIYAAGMTGEWDRMMRYFSSMKSAGVQADVYTFTSLIRACQSCGNRWQNAFVFFNQMRPAGVQPNVQAYTALVSVCNHAGQPAEALRALYAMDAAGVQLDAVAFNSVMATCAGRGQWESAWAVMATMQRSGVEPTARSHNLLLSACERAGQAERALEVFQRMQRRAKDAAGRLDPDLVTYNTVLSACAKAGMFSKVMQLYEEMSGLQLEPDVFTLTSLITACDQAEKGWQLPVQLAHEFESRDVKLNTVAVNLLMQVLGKSGEWQQAMQLFEKMKAPGARPDLRPNLITYSVLLVSCRYARQYQLGVELYHELLQTQMRPNSYIFHAMLAICKEGALWEEGRAVLQAMQARKDIRSDGLAIAAQELLFSTPALRPVATAAQAAIESGRATRRWISRGPS